MSIDTKRLDERLEGAMARLSVDTIHAAESEPSSVTSSNPPSPSPFSDTLPRDIERSRSDSCVQDSVTPSTTASSSSLPTTASTPTMNVKFAPLPEIGPRKRRSNQPLGMAARAQLVRRRRPLQSDDQVIQQDGEDNVVVVSNSVWTSPEFEEQRRRVEILAARHAQIQANNAAMEVEDILNQPDDEEDHPPKKRSNTTGEEPALSLRKKVRGAGLTLWKRVASKDMAGSREKDEDPEKLRPNGAMKRQRRNSNPERPKAPILRRTSTPPPPVPPLRHSLVRSNTEPPTSTNSSASTPIQSSLDLHLVVDSDVEPEEGGGVWEEEIGNTFRRNPRQSDFDETATILASVMDEDVTMLDIPHVVIDYLEPPTQSLSPPLSESNRQPFVGVES